MTERHVPEELLNRFLRLEASKQESRQIVRHLLGGCSHCLKMAHRLASETGLFTSLKESGKARWKQSYAATFTQALASAAEEEQRLALEKLRGWAQWAQLEPLAPHLRFIRVKSDPRFHTFGLYERLLEASRWYRQTKPADAVDIVRLAIEVVERLDPATLGEEHVADLKARAWAALGNAKRVAEDFEGARLAFKEAWRLLEIGTGDPIERARLIDLESSYLKDIGEFERAESFLEQALGIFRKAGKLYEQGRILFKMGDAIGYVYPERGIAHLRRALALIDTVREPFLKLCALHGLARFLCDLDQPEEALAVLERARPLFNQFPDDLIQLRFHWVEAQIASHLGEYAEAEIMLGQLWEEFRARNLNQEVVLVSIDLAQVLVAKGEAERAAQLAAECYFIMKNWGLLRDAFVAWLILQHALSQGKGTGSCS
jgi:tetratricopeptide (TPR) repeat protein